jgi:ectoine hydroxylase-related dioxygenase (phytanoyl-CoA dioxygenase family)
MSHIAHLIEHGYAIVRGVYTAADVEVLAGEMDRLKAEALRHHASYRDRNLLYVIRPHPILGRHLRFIHWAAYISPVMERFRTDRRQLAIVEPFLGKNLKQIGNQVTWKTPGTDDTTFGFHQDARFRRPASAFRELATSYVQTFIAIDPHRVENGCLKVYPGSHKRGLLDLPADRSVMDSESENTVLREWGLDPGNVVDVLLDPGDVALWLPHTLHASGPNQSAMDRRAYVNGYVIAENCDRGEWAFRDGEPCQLGEPVLVQYDDLYTKPEPHYVDGAFYPPKPPTA